MVRARLMLVVALLLLALAALGGCGDDESGTDASQRTATDSPSRSGDATGTQPDDGAVGEERKGAATDSDESDTAKRSQPDAEPEPAPEPERSESPPEDRPTTTPSNRRGALKGRALVRCLRPAARQKGDRRLRTQARCLGMSAQRLRRLIVAQCRRATKTEAASRNCIRLATGE